MKLKLNPILLAIKQAARGSDANVIAHRIVEETIFGTTPATPAFEDLGVTGSPDLGFEPTTQKSNRLNPSRAIQDSYLLNIAAKGGLDFELSHNSVSKLIPGLMFSAWAEKAQSEGAEINSVNVGASISVDDTDEAYAVGMLIQTTGFGVAGNNTVFRAGVGSNDTTVAWTGALAEASPPGTARVKQVGLQGGASDITATATGLGSTALNFTQMKLAVGEWIKVGGSAVGDQFDTAGCNVWARITAIAATALDLDIPAGWAVDAGTGKTIKVFVGDRIRNGTTRHSYSIERYFADHKDSAGASQPTYEYSRGMMCDSMSITAEAASLVTASVKMIGKDTVYQTSRFAGATTVSKDEGTAYNTSSNVAFMKIDQDDISDPEFIMSYSLELKNNLDPKNGVGHLGAVKVGVGSFEATGTLDTYFDTIGIVERITNQTEFSVTLNMFDADGNYLLIDHPRTKASGGTIQGVELNGETNIPLAYETLEHYAYGFALQMQKFQYVE
jgi:hypothetical protein